MSENRLLRCELCGDLADHAEHFYERVRGWCEKHTPWSGHWEYCTFSCLKLCCAETISTAEVSCYGTCQILIPNTYIICGEGDNYCSSGCEEKARVRCARFTRPSADGKGYVADSRSKVRFASIEMGPRPNERAVKLMTTEGQLEELIIDHSTNFNGEWLNDVRIIDRSQRGYLVELPRETSSGKWRVWLRIDDVVIE